MSEPVPSLQQRVTAAILDGAARLFAAQGEQASMTDVAAAAGVARATVYRYFPNRQALLETLYLEEVEGICRMAEQQRDSDDPWEALTSWVERFIGYIATKQALAAELTNYLDRDAQLFKSSRAAIWAAAEPLLTRAQEAGVVRLDAEIGDVMHMVMGIAKVPAADPSQTTHIVRMALDGLRYRPDA